jgi:hypothetical protein
MDLEELLQREGLDPERLRETVAWAKDRADELVAGLVADAELGPLLDDQWEDEGSQPRLLPRPPVERREPAASEEAARQSSDPGLDFALADAGLVAPSEPAVAEEVTQPRAFPPAPRDREGSRPNLPLPPLPLPGVPRPDASPSTTEEIVDDEIELLDEEDLELVEESLARRAPQSEHGAEHAPEAEPGPDGEGEDVPEWKRALSSAQMGGGLQADRDSGLYRLDRVSGAPTPAPEPEADGDG